MYISTIESSESVSYICMNVDDRPARVAKHCVNKSSEGLLLGV